MNKVQTKEGWWIIEEDTHLGKWIQETGKLDHDEFLTPIAVDNIPVGGIVIDCGAMYGDHTIAYCRKVGPKGAVIAIEAGKEVFECLTENAKRFENSVILINAAVCDRPGGKAVHVVEEANVGMSIVKPDGSVSTGKTEHEVNTITLNGLVHDARLERLDFIKIDVEGWELKVLQGAKKCLEKFKPKMIIEMNEFTLEQQGATYKDIYDLLLEYGYEWRIIQPNCNGASSQYDIACWPKIEEPLKIVPKSE